MVELASADVICNGRALGAVLGLSAQQIERLARDHVLKTVRSSKLRGRHYRLNDAVQAYLRYQHDYVKAQCSSSDGDGYNTARSRRMAALALIEEMRARQLSGELIERAQVVLAFAQLVAVTKSRVLGIAPNCARLVTGRTDHSFVFNTIHAAARRSLHEIATFDPSKIRDKKAKRTQEQNGDDADADDDQL
jgi:hypothetical protein